MRIGAVMFLAAAVALASASGSGMRVKSAVKSSKDNASVHQDKPVEDEGEHIFATQCSRCHATPQMLPPSAAKTIVRHMRVRANLTAEQERLLLQYIAP